LNTILPHIENKPIFGDRNSLNYIVRELKTPLLSALEAECNLSEDLETLLVHNFDENHFFLILTHTIRVLSNYKSKESKQFNIFNNNTRKETIAKVDSLIAILEQIINNRGQSDYFWFNDLINLLDLYDQKTLSYFYYADLEDLTIELREFLDILTKIPLAQDINSENSNTKANIRAKKLKKEIESGFNK
jgi:hypothetical protein